MTASSRGDNNNDDPNTGSDRAALPALTQVKTGKRLIEYKRWHLSAREGERDVECILRISLCAAALLMGFACFDTAWAASATACDAYARNYARDASRQGQVLGRGAVGSLIGLGIGAATGGAAVGAAIGGGVGVLSGGARRQNTADRMYQAAYQDCMAGRVH